MSELKLPHGPYITMNTKVHGLHAQFCYCELLCVTCKQLRTCDVGAGIGKYSSCHLQTCDVGAGIGEY